MMKGNSTVLIFLTQRLHHSTRIGSVEYFLAEKDPHLILKEQNISLSWFQRHVGLVGAPRYRSSRQHHHPVLKFGIRRLPIQNSRFVSSHLL
jgi:hypothetical protein